MTEANNTRVWSDELILETRTKYGSAAHRNRARYSGRKVHVLHCDYVVGIVEGHQPRPGTFGAEFVRTGKPVLFSCRPVCGATSGQHAGRPFANMTTADVSCTKCAARIRSVNA